MDVRVVWLVVALLTTKPDIRINGYPPDILHAPDIHWLSVRLRIVTGYPADC